VIEPAHVHVHVLGCAYHEGVLMTRRLHVLLDDDRWLRLEVEAARRQVAMAVLVREAIDATFPGGRSARRAAADLILAADPAEVPEDPADLKREIEEARSPWV
jgi:hypothetical protein